MSKVCNLPKCDGVDGGCPECKYCVETSKRMDEVTYRPAMNYADLRMKNQRNKHRVARRYDTSLVGRNLEAEFSKITMSTKSKTKKTSVAGKASK